MYAGLRKLDINPNDGKIYKTVI